MSLKFNPTMRWDLERTWNEKIGSKGDVAPAMAGLPNTAACSPNPMTLPGAYFMNVGANGDDGFLSMTMGYAIRQ